MKTPTRPLAPLRKLPSSASAESDDEARITNWVKAQKELPRDDAGPSTSTTRAKRTYDDVRLLDNEQQKRMSADAGKLPDRALCLLSAC